MKNKIALIIYSIIEVCYFALPFFLFCSDIKLIYLDSGLLILIFLLILLTPLICTMINVRISNLAGRRWLRFISPAVFLSWWIYLYFIELSLYKEPIKSDEDWMALILLNVYFFSPLCIILFSRLLEEGD